MDGAVTRDRRVATIWPVYAPRMPTMSCDQCEQEFTADTFDEWFQRMRQHYMADHADFMKASANKSKEEGMKWMADMKAEFEAL